MKLYFKFVSSTGSKIRWGMWGSWRSKEWTATNSLQVRNIWKVRVMARDHWMPLTLVEDQVHMNWERICQINSLRFWKEEDLCKDCSALSLMDKKWSRESAPVKTAPWHGGNRPLAFFTWNCKLPSEEEDLRTLGRPCSPHGRWITCVILDTSDDWFM